MKTQSIVRSMIVSCLTLIAVTAQATPLFDNYSFDNAVAAHNAAPAVAFSRANEILGFYRMVASASRSYRGDFMKKEITGIANADKSILSLQIDLNADASKVNVTQKNLSKLGQDQGPSEIVFQPRGTFAFAQLSYKNGTVLSDAVYFYSECKIVDVNQLLCAKRFMVQDPRQVNAQQAAMHDTIVAYDLYVH